MEFPFRMSPEGLTYVQHLTKEMGATEVPAHDRHRRVRDLKALSYVMLHEGLRTRMPGQAHLDAFNNFIDFELPKTVREQGHPIEVYAINSVNNVAIRLLFTDISVEPPTHTEPGGRRTYLYPRDVGQRHIPYDINVSVDLCLEQTFYDIVPPLKSYKPGGKAFYAPCLIVNDPHNFNGWGLAVGRATTCTIKQSVDQGQILRFKPGVWEAFHADACRRHNHRSKCPATVAGYKRQLWSRLSARDQRIWNHYCSDGAAGCPDYNGQACVKLIVFIGYTDPILNHFVVEKMGKKTIMDTFGDVLATLPPYIEQSSQLRRGAKTEYVYGIPFIRLPCMLGSEYCHTLRQGLPPRMDAGIVLTGTCDKVVITQQQLGNNRVFLFDQKAGQVIAEIRSAHIGKRRSTSAFRLIISPKDGAYVILPFLKRASGIDVRVPIVSFIRLMWEYDVFDDPDLRGVNWRLFVKVLDTLTATWNHVGDAKVVAFRRRRARPKDLRPLYLSGIPPKQAKAIWDLACGVPLLKPRKPVRRGAGRQRKKSTAKTSAKTSSPTYVQTLLKMLGRRTIDTLDAATAVLDLSFFGVQTSCTPRDRLDRYLEIRSFLQDTTKPEDFSRPVGHILTRLAVDGARERTLRAQKSYVLNNVLRSELFPHLGDTASVQIRREKLFYAMNQVFAPLYNLFTGRRKFPSDKDSMGNKRLDLFDEVIGIYFRQQSQSNRGTLAKAIQSEAKAGVHIDAKLLYGLIANKRFETSIRYPFSTGKTKLSDKRPGNKKSNQSGAGGIQQTSGNVMARMSHLRRVRHAHINQDNKAIKPRMVHVKDTRRLCPAESPEGTMCGLLKNMALLLHVSTGVTDTNTMAALIFCLVDPTWLRMPHEPPWDVKYVLVVNGVVKAFVDPTHMEDLCEVLRQCRRAANIRFDTSIYLNGLGTTLHVDSNAGRTLDPLIRTASVLDGRFFAVCQNFVASQGHFSNLILALVRYGCVDYVCANEEASYWISSSWADWLSQLSGHRKSQESATAEFVPMYTHLMVHAVALFDYAVASMIFPECNQGPRNTYQAKMLTQAVSLPDEILESSPDLTKYYLNYGQVPLVQSATCLYDGLRQFTSGLNCVVQMRRSSFNIEDAIIFNQGSIDRGLFHMTYTYNMLLEPDKMHQIEIPNPRTCRNTKQANYKKLDPKTGIIRCGEYLSTGDVIVGLTKKVTDFGRGGKVKIDVSLIYTRKIPARVTKIVRTTNRFGDPLLNFTVMASNKEMPFPVDVLRPPVSTCEPPPPKKTRTAPPCAVPHSAGRSVATRLKGISVPDVGEKFASRSAQKGVIGLIVPEADMDFVCEGRNIGMRADLCFNPDGIPSRMTMGSPMMEMLLGVLGAVLGTQIDGTPFSMADIDLKELGDMLEKAGLNRFCEESMCSGVTGERIRGENHLPAWMASQAEPGARRGCVMGIVYYQRLAHFVAAKIHSRNGGPLNELTRQPPPGRARNGGLRCGTMEVDALIANGVAALLRERMLLASDNHYAPVCTLCRLLGETARDGSYFCRNCGLPGTCEQIQLPYAAKIMIHLYQSVNMKWGLAISPTS